MQRCASRACADQGHHILHRSSPCKRQTSAGKDERNCVMRKPSPIPLVAEPLRENDPLAIEAGVVIVSLKKPIPGGAQCHYCQRPASTRDHIVAKTRGGVNSWWNLVPSCARCNGGRKGSGSTWCSCAFCMRAIWMYDMGYRRR
ncbi:HNH endonuclease [Microbacterium gorillae]|uniref:HNH endonuclease n=1 Tax=Microbacterium gorillae TaxID=1231063 RepID=UPI003D996084